MEIPTHAQKKEMEILKANIKSLETTIKYQQSLQTQHTIPKQLQPMTHLKTEENSLLISFKQDFEKIFFKHLSQVVTANQVILEIKRARLTQLAETTRTNISNNPNTHHKDMIQKPKNGEPMDCQPQHQGTDNMPTPRQNANSNTNTIRSKKRKNTNKDTATSKSKKTKKTLKHNQQSDQVHHFLGASHYHPNKPT